MFIARLEIPDGAPIAVRQTLKPGHYTLKGSPDALLACVVFLQIVYGPHSDAATSLALVRDDVPNGRLIARGAALVDQALSRFPLQGKSKNAAG